VKFFSFALFVARSHICGTHYKSHWREEGSIDDEDRTCALL